MTGGAVSKGTLDEMSGVPIPPQYGGPKIGVGMTLYIVMGSAGEYEERREWLSGVFLTDSGATASISYMQSKIPAAKTAFHAYYSGMEPTITYDDILAAYGNIDPHMSGMPDLDTVKWEIITETLKP